MLGKKAFLRKLTEQKVYSSLKIEKPEFEGTSPPSVFVGQENYPKVFVGPMLSQETESMIYDSPESWLGNYKKEDIINFRLNLLRCKKAVSVFDVNSRYSQQMQEIALAKKSVESNAEFDKIPRGITFSEEHAPFGPSAQLTSLDTENQKMQHDLEKAYYDTDLKANNAVVDLNKKGLNFTSIQKALSVGSFGIKRSRKLVPTRWSITATDDILGKNHLQDVKENDVIKEYRVYESKGLHNNYSILLTPTVWQYEAIEAFINLMDNRTFMFSDYERYFGRQKYSEMGGCYYAQRNIIAEKLREQEEQAGAFVFREANEEYVPTGVWLCRELTRKAMNSEPKTFPTMKDALEYVNSTTRLGAVKLKENMSLINNYGKQKTLLDF